jgi:polyhydroxyalkanoate synthesis regulator phasin
MTSMQELLEWVRATLPMDLETPQMIEQKIESMLEKEEDLNARIEELEWEVSGLKEEIKNL